MQWLKQAQTRLEPHFNRALLLSILACLVILLTYLFGGAGAFVALRQHFFPTTASSVLTTGTSPNASTASGSNDPSTKSSVPNSVATALAAVLQVSPLELPLNCALGASANDVVTLSNPDSAAHSFALLWNGASTTTQGFSASLQTGNVAAHDTRAVTVSVLPLSLVPTLDSQYLWVTDTTGGHSHLVAKVHVTCSTLPAGVPPTPTLPPLP